MKQSLLLILLLALVPLTHGKSLTLETANADGSRTQVLTIKLPDNGAPATGRKGTVQKFRNPSSPDNAEAGLKIFFGVELKAKLLKNGYVEFQLNKYTLNEIVKSPNNIEVPIYTSRTASNVIKDDHKLTLQQFSDLGQVFLTVSD